MKFLYMFSCLFLLCTSTFAQERIVISKPGTEDRSFDFSGFSASAGAPVHFFNGLRKNLALPAMFR